MAFLFKSKKNADRAQVAKDGQNGVAGSVSSLQSANGRGKENEKGAIQDRDTPSSSVNNSITSLNGVGGMPSPEQANGRRGPSTELAQDLPVSTICIVFYQMWVE